MSYVAMERERLPIGSIGRRATGWWAMLFIVATEAAIFAYLLFSYYFFAIQPHSAPWPPGGPPELRLALPNTVILIASSVAVWWGEEGIRRGGSGRLTIALLIAFVLGVAFVVIQGLEWSNKTFSFSSGVFGSLYYTITGFHMAHVVVGLVVLLAMLAWSALGYFNAVRHAAISIGALYWHFVDVVWLTVFFTFYVTPRIG
ncbi:MAG: cytochrome c oxidase subunit 3 [Gemmatimonas sp.]